MSELRVLHAPVNVGNQPWVLSRAERDHGVNSDVVVVYSTWLGYPYDVCLGEVGDRGFRTILKRGIYGLTSPFRYDVMHYYFGRSLINWDDLAGVEGLQFLDLKIARRLGRKVFFTLQGCDVRIASESNARNAVTMCGPGKCGAYQTCLASLDLRRRWFIDKIIPLCDRVFYLNPELAHYVPGGQFLPYASFDVERTETTPPEPNGRPLILHAPSDPGIKGTPRILAAIEALKSRHEFDFQLVENLPHSEAMMLYRRADLVIDQVLAGWYGGFAVELMAMGKPVACYLREDDLGVLPPAMRSELPLLPIDPEHIEEQLDALLVQRSSWPEWGLRARDFACRWHNPNRIAQAMIAAYRDPDSRFQFEPA